MKTILVCSLLAAVASAPAQTTFQHEYGGRVDDEGRAVARTADGGYVITGYTGSFGAGGHDFWLLRTDPTGDTLWSRTFGGPELDDAFSVAQTADSGYIVVGHTESFGAGEYDLWLVKTDALGEVKWTRTYGGERRDSGNSLALTADGGYIIVGHTMSPAAIASHLWVLKTDSLGDTLWTRTFDDRFCFWFPSVAVTADGGYVVAGSSTYRGADSYDVWLLRIDPTGDTLWTRTFGGPHDDYGQSVTQTADGGFVVAGWTLSFGHGGVDAWLIRTDSTGDILWTRCYGGQGSDRALSVAETADGGFIITGYTRPTNNLSDLWLIKIDSIGDTLWTRTHGGRAEDRGRSVAQTADGGYVVGGYTASFGAGFADFWLLKTDSLGRIAAGDVEERGPVTAQRLPGPTVMRAAELARFEGRILDVQGREVRSATSDFGVCTSALPPGVYFLLPNCERRMPNAEVQTRKVIVTR